MQVVLAISISIEGLQVRQTSTLVAAVALTLEMSRRPQAALQALHLQTFTGSTAITAVAALQLPCQNAQTATRLNKCEHYVNAAAGKYQ
jgi:hypothetical protein